MDSSGCNMRKDIDRLIFLHGKYNPLDKRQRPSADYKRAIKIVVYSPPPNIKCGGITVIHNLTRTLQILNPDINYLIYYNNYRKHRNNFCTNYFNPFWMDDRTIVIYPEIVSGNPLKAQNVVRWILLDLGIEMPPNHYESWGTNDIVYHWEPSRLSNTKQLVNIWLNPDIKLTKPVANRNNSCYGLKKMQWIPNKLHENGITLFHNHHDKCIDHMSMPQIVQTFNNTQRFYCYDPNTFYSIMAPLCGCITILHPMYGITKENYFQSRILHHHASGFTFDYGIAYGNDQFEIEKALETVKDAPEKFAYLNSLYQQTVNSFLTDMINMINHGQIPNNTVKNIYLS